MSQTFELACHDCKVSLWIGQGWSDGRPGGKIYTTEEHLEKLRDFLFAHLRHRLEFNDSERVCHWDYRSLDDDEPCGRKLAPGQYWGFCGETDMGQTLPALCTDCGGEYKLADDAI